MIRTGVTTDFDSIYFIITDASRAYKGIIPWDCWKEPYMTREELASEIKNGVTFWLYEAQSYNHLSSTYSSVQSSVLGVMGVQHMLDATLIRHAYVKTSEQNRGVGGELIEHVKALEKGPLLVGTWKDASWAIKFYERHGFFTISSPERKDDLLKRYWTVPKRQRDESVVLADRRML